MWRFAVKKVLWFMVMTPCGGFKPLDIVCPLALAVHTTSFPEQEVQHGIRMIQSGSVGSLHSDDLQFVFTLRKVWFRVGG